MNSSAYTLPHELHSTQSGQSSHEGTSLEELNDHIMANTTVVSSSSQLKEQQCPVSSAAVSDNIGSGPKTDGQQADLEAKSSEPHYYQTCSQRLPTMLEDVVTSDSEPSVVEQSMFFVKETKEETYNPENFESCEETNCDKDIPEVKKSSINFNFIKNLVKKTIKSQVKETEVIENRVQVRVKEKVSAENSAAEVLHSVTEDVRLDTPVGPSLDTSQPLSASVHEQVKMYSFIVV